MPKVKDQEMSKWKKTENFSQIFCFTFYVFRSKTARLCSLKNAPRVPSIFFLCLRMFDCIQIADMLKWKQSRTFDRIYYPIEIVSIIQALHRDRLDCFYQFEIVNYSAGSWYGPTQWSNRTAAKLFFSNHNFNYTPPLFKDNCSFILPDLQDG